MQSTHPHDRLTRSRSDRMIAGVAGGIARYLAIDPVLVRVGLVALAFTGVGILVYPLLWLIMPLEGATGPSVSSALGEMRSQAARLGDEAREAFVGTGPARSSRFDPMTGQPLASDEVPVTNVAGGEATPGASARPTRGRLLGYVLLALGGFLLLQMIAPGAEQFIFPMVLIAVGFLLLKRRIG